MDEKVIFDQVNSHPMGYENVQVKVGGGINLNPVYANIRYLTVENIDTCEYGWTYFGDSNMCYKYIPEKLNWQEAQDHCHDLTNDKVSKIIHEVYISPALCFRENWPQFQMMLPIILFPH